MSKKQVRETVEYMILEDADTGHRRSWRQAAFAIAAGIGVVIAFVVVVASIAG